MECQWSYFPSALKRNGVILENKREDFKAEDEPK